MSERNLDTLFLVMIFVSLGGCWLAAVFDWPDLLMTCILVGAMSWLIWTVFY